MRRFLFHLHSWMGLIAGLGLVAIGLTGSALVFREEIENLAMPQRVLASDSSKMRLDLDGLLAHLERQLKGYEPVGWRRSPSSGRNDELLVALHVGGESKMLWIDPGTGEIHGTPTDSSQTLTGWLLELHYTLLGGQIGTFLAGILAALLCLLGISGLWIYRNFWTSVMRLRWKLSSRIFFSDLHKMIGISSVGFNLILGFTGAYWNLTSVVGHLLNGPDPEPPKIGGRVMGETVSLDVLLKQAQISLPGFEWTYISLPAEADEPVAFYGRLKDQHVLRGEFGSSVTFNSQTGTLEGVVDIRTTPFWNQVTDAFMPLHFGTFGALPVKILWCVGGLAPGILAITGYLLWWKRKHPFRGVHRAKLFAGLA